MYKKILNKKQGFLSFLIITLPYFIIAFNAIVKMLNIYFFLIFYAKPPSKKRSLNLATPAH
nr:MAG TPA: hypothetical protein [Caudoviricetes sp.]